MPPNAETLDATKLNAEIGSEIPETADQRLKSAETHLGFREREHDLQGEYQKIVQTVEEIKTMAASAITEAEEETTTQKNAFENLGDHVTIAIAEKTVLPKWGLVAIIILVFLVVFGIIFFCVRRFLKKRRTKDGGKGKKGVDMKSVQLLGSAYKEKVQPDMEELVENAEEGDEEDKRSEPYLGQLNIRLGYHRSANSLEVTVIKAADLPALDMGGTPASYVKVYLLPDTKKKFVTRVIRKTLSPEFYETFTFKGLHYDDAKKTTLVFAVLDFDRFPKDDQIGEVKVPLRTLDFSQLIQEWLPLTSVEGEGGQKMKPHINIKLKI